MKTLSWNILLLSLVSLVSALKDCSAPPRYPHTELLMKFRSRLKFSSGEKVSYSCAEDFSPQRGSRSVQCQDGVWDKLGLKCEKRSCGNAGDLLNGHFEYEGNSYVGEKVNAVCDEGYTLKGPGFMTCKKSGWTGEFPTCEASEGETTCSTPAVSNSVQSGVSVHHVGENLTFTCSPGFQLDGASQVTCGSDGQWEPRPPQCRPEPVKTPQSPASEGGCGVPPSGFNSNLADEFILRKSFPHGTKVYYMCNVGYAAAGGSRMRQCRKGRWTPLRLRCERTLCGNAGDILHGHYIYTGVEFGDTATAVCDEGFHLVGPTGTRRCMAKGWDGRLAVCEAVECETPSARTNAETKGAEEPSYPYRSVIEYQCSKGVLIGQKQIWCNADGTWSSPPPQCKEMTCLPPNVHHAYWMGAHKHTFQNREAISIECSPGFTLIGSRTITCNGGHWFPRLPKCQRMYRRG